MPEIVSKEELLEMAGREVGPGSWFRIDQERIDLFADATLDHQFIHVDPERAAATPMGGTIAHGFLTLSMLAHLSDEITVQPADFKLVFNYGLNKVRFLTPVRAGSEVRLRAKVLDVTEKVPGRLLVRSTATIEIRGEDNPALVAETLVLFVV